MDVLTVDPACTSIHTAHALFIAGSISLLYTLYLTYLNGRISYEQQQQMHKRYTKLEERKGRGYPNFLFWLRCYYYSFALHCIAFTTYYIPYRTQRNDDNMCLPCVSLCEGRLKEDTRILHHHITTSHGFKLELRFGLNI